MAQRARRPTALAYDVDGEEVVHTVTMSLNPDMNGTRQRRTARFSGDGELTLSAFEATKNGGERHHILQWRKIAKEG
jgi:hypothetical protein